MRCLSIDVLSGTTTATGVGMMTETDTQVGTGAKRGLVGTFAHCS